MSFDPGVYDPAVFGSAQAGDSCLFDGAIFDSAIFDVCEEVAPPDADAPAVRRGGGSKRKRPRYWWEPEEKQLPEPEMVAVAPQIIEPLPFVPRRPFSAGLPKKVNKKRLAMIAALIDE